MNKKRHILRFGNGFTLVELLVVILIIGVLAAVSLSAYSGIRNQAWRTRSRNLASQLAHAWTQYLLEHREFPKDVPEYSDKDHLELLNYGKTAGSYFLEVTKEEKVNGLRDKWGDLYHVRLDTDYDGLIENPFYGEYKDKVSGPLGNEKIRASALVWSERYGPRHSKAKNLKTEDDIIAWH